MQAPSSSWMTSLRSSPTDAERSAAAFSRGGIPADPATLMSVLASASASAAPVDEAAEAARYQELVRVWDTLKVPLDARLRWMLALAARAPFARHIADAWRAQVRYDALIQKTCGNCSMHCLAGHCHRYYEPFAR